MADISEVCAGLGVMLDRRIELLESALVLLCARKEVEAEHAVTTDNTTARAAWCSPAYSDHSALTFGKLAMAPSTLIMASTTATPGPGATTANRAATIDLPLVTPTRCSTQSPNRDNTRGNSTAGSLSTCNKSARERITAKDDEADSASASNSSATMTPARCSAACPGLNADPDRGVAPPLVVHTITTGASSVSSKSATEPSASSIRCSTPCPCSDDSISSSITDNIDLPLVAPTRCSTPRSDNVANTISTTTTPAKCLVLCPVLGAGLSHSVASLLSVDAINTGISSTSPTKCSMKCQEYVAADDISFVLISFNSMTQTMCSKLCSPYTATAIGSLDTTMTTTCLALGTNDGANNVQHVRAVTGVLITSTGGSLAPSVKSVSATKFNRKVCAKCSMECLSEDSVAISVTDMSWLPAAEMALIPGQRYCHHNSHLRGGVTRPPPHPPWATSIFCCKTWWLYRTLAGRQPALNVCSTKVWLLLSSWSPWSPSTHQYKVKRIGIQILYQLGELWESCFYLPDQVVCAKSMSVKMLDWSENSCNWTQPTQRCRFKFIQFAECNQYKLRPISIRIQFGEAQKYFFNLPTVCELIINWWHVQFRSKLRHQNVGAIHQKLHWESSERYIILINLGGQVATLLHFLTERLWYAVTLSLGFLSAHQRKTILLRPWPPPPKHAVLLLWYVKWARLNSSRIAVVHADLKLLKSSAALQMLRFGISGERRESVEQENFDLIPYLICATACPTDNLFFKPPQALVEFLLTNVIDALDMLALDTSWNYWSICLTAMLIQIASNGIEVLLLLQLSDQSQGAFEVTVPLCYADQNVREQVPLKPWACIQWKSVGAWTGLNTSIGCQWRDQPTRSMEELSNPWDPGGFNDSGLGASRVSRGGDVMDPGSPRAARLQTTKDWAAWAGL